MNLRQFYWPVRCWALAGLALCFGCQAPRGVASVASSNRAAGSPASRVAVSTVQSGGEGERARGSTPKSPPLPLSPTPKPSPARLTSFQQHHETRTPDDPFVGQAELQLPQIVGEVQARNQSLQAMRAAWLAAAQRYPQDRALDDPVFSSMIAPASLNSGIANIPGNSAGYIVGGAQKLPWFGKRTLRGEAALADSRAARWDVDDARLSIIEATGVAYYDYYLVRQDLALNVANSGKLREYHDIAARKYEANLAPQQDMLQAEVELAELARRQIELERLERIATARINTLMHRPPDAYLPPAPAYLGAPMLALSVANLRAIALSGRPDLAALAAKIRAEQTRVQLAQKEFLPDFEVFGRYDNFWSQQSLRGQVGVNMNVPLYRDKRYAAVREAQWRLSQRRAEYNQRIDDINREVQTAYERFDEAQQTVGIYTEQILPAARKNVDSAFAAYETGRGDFLRLVAAQRQLISLQERYQESIADYHRRRVELERVVGQPLSPATPAEEIPPGR
jgi:cobalt-zinc-cadmium efflux system outer membrane protein